MMLGIVCTFYVTVCGSDAFDNRYIQINLYMIQRYTYLQKCTNVTFCYYKSKSI